MSAVFHIKYCSSYLHVHESMRKVSWVAEARQASPFTSEAEAWIAARKLKLDPDFVEVVPQNSESETKS